MEQTKAPERMNRLTITLLVIYLIALFWILILKLGVQFSYMNERRTNLVPFSRAFFTGENILNALIFVPLGLYAGILFKQSYFIIKVLLVFLLSLLVEGLQYILRIGAFDVTDLITNTIGGVIGLIIFTGIKKAFGSHVRAQRIVNTIAVAGTALMILLLVLLKMNMLPVRYQ